MPKIEPFEKYSDRYDEWFEQHSEIYRAELEAIRQLMPFPKGKCLEVGVGSGKFAIPLGINIGVEPAENMAVKAEREGIQVFRHIAENLQFPDSEFDVVLMVTTICFVDDILKAFREAFRVLKTNGCIIVGFVDRDSGLGKKYNSNRNASVFYKDATFFSTQEVRNYLVEAGFENMLFKQTLIPDEVPEMIYDGFGKGAFIAIRADK